ncbi:MAG: hypothetical protein ACREBD_06790, partial [Blastocatellia bacterium]
MLSKTCLCYQKFALSETFPVSGISNLQFLDSVFQAKRQGLVALIIVSAIGGGLRKSSFLIFLSYIFLLAKPKQENVG